MLKLIFLVLLFNGCQNKSAVVGSKPSQPEPDMVSGFGSALPWSNVLWDKALLDDIKSTSLPRTKDIKEWCSKDLTDDQLVLFYANLFVHIAKYESNWNPKTSYKENFKDGSGQFVISSGLFQISLESVNQKRYDCQIKAQDELFDPITNIKCSVKLASYWLKRDLVLSSKSNEGFARYWSTLRPSSKTYNNIKSNVKALPFCN